MNATGLASLLNSISWREPLWGLLAFMPLSSLLLKILLIKKNSVYADAHLMPWVVYQQPSSLISSLFSKNSAYILAWILLGISLAGPRLAIDNPAQFSKADINIMLVVDVSRSMHATDIEPSRLRRTEIEIEELLERATGARIGIVIFAARAHLFVPLTTDHEALRYYLNSLDSLRLPTNGSNPVAALELAYNELNNSKDPSAIIIISDGDFPEFNDNPLFSSGFIKPDIPVYALGIGSREGAAISLENGEWLQHGGQPVISRLNERNLQALLTQNSGGDETVPTQASRKKNYSLATGDDSDWQKLYGEGIAKLAATADSDQEHHDLWRELFFWPLSAALILLWISIVPFGVHPSAFSFLKKPNRKFSPKSRTIPSYAENKKNVLSINILVMATLFALASLYPYKQVLAIGLDNLETGIEIKRYKAFQKYSSGDYSSAAMLYKNISGFSARLGEGASHYKLNNFNSAIRQFRLAILAANSDSERAIALFNLGNAYFQTGNYQAATSVYNDALFYNPRHKNIQHNLEFSAALKKSVEEQLRTSSQYSRPGSGPQLSPSREAMENNRGGSLAIDQSESLPDKGLPLPKLSDIPGDELDALIEKGLEQIKLAAQNSSPTKDKNYIRSKLSNINARLLMSELNDNQAELWKRLFEVEEGFPAPLSQPRDIPGVTPW